MGRTIVTWDQKLEIVMKFQDGWPTSAIYTYFNKKNKRDKLSMRSIRYHLNKYKSGELHDDRYFADCTIDQEIKERRRLDNLPRVHCHRVSSDGRNLCGCDFTKSAPSSTRNGQDSPSSRRPAKSTRNPAKSPRNPAKSPRNVRTRLRKI